MTANDDETPEFWRTYPKDDLVQRVASLHRQRREAVLETVQVARAAVTSLFLRSGRGIEVGAGNRPFPVPGGVHVDYGDVRDASALRTYFNEDIAGQEFIDAQSFRGVEDASLDFVLSAHVIEHLEDPLGSVRESLRVLKSGGIFVCAIPDKRFTFDVDRPLTPLSHVMQDLKDGGDSTRVQAYEEHLTYVHPLMAPRLSPDEIRRQALGSAQLRPDIHFHCWDARGATEMMSFGARSFGATAHGPVFVVNENIFVLRKLF